MKIFRRISALALVLVLVCLFSASAFAASPSYRYGRLYEDIDTAYVDVNATISRYSTEGNIMLSTPDVYGNEITISAYEQHYIMAVDSNMSLSYPVTFGNTGEHIQNLSASKSYPDYSINTMGWAVYDFFATFLLNQTWPEFNHSGEVSLVDR